jgi:hypothetical protein
MYMSSKILLIVCLVILKVYTEKTYKVVSYRFIDQPLLSKSLGSQYEFNINPTVFEYNNSYYLIVRCQNSMTCQSQGVIIIFEKDTSLIRYHGCYCPILTVICPVLS